MAGATHNDVLVCVDRLRRFADGRFARPEDAEDAVQQALAEVLADAEYIERGMIWRRLKELVKTYALSAKHQSRRQSQIQDLDAAVDTPSVERPIREIEERELRGHWRKEALEAVAELPEEQRKIFTMVSLEGQKVEAVARQLNTSPASVSRKNQAASATLLGSLLRKGADRRDFWALAPFFAIGEFARHKPKTATFTGISLCVFAALVTWSAFGGVNTDNKDHIANQNSHMSSTTEERDNERSSASTKSGQDDSSESNPASAETNTESNTPDSLPNNGIPNENEIVAPLEFMDGPPAQPIPYMPTAIDHSDLSRRYEPHRPQDPLQWVEPKITSGQFKGKIHGIAQHLARDGTVIGEFIYAFGSVIQARTYENGRIKQLLNLRRGQVVRPGYRYKYEGEKAIREEMQGLSGFVVQGPKGEEKESAYLIDANFLPDPLLAISGMELDSPTDPRAESERDRVVDEFTQIISLLEDNGGPEIELSWDLAESKNAREWTLNAVVTETKSMAYSMQFHTNGSIKNIVVYDTQSAAKSYTYLYHYYPKEKINRPEFLLEHLEDGSVETQAVVYD